MIADETRTLGALSVVGWVILGVVGLLLLFAAGLTLRYFTADVRGRVNAQETIKSGSNRIAQYNQFFNLCAAVQAAEGQLDGLEVELAATSLEKDRQRILSNITGVSANRLRIISQYNANATKSYTAGQFRDSDLPYSLPAVPYTAGGRKTVCAAD